MTTPRIQGMNLGPIQSLLYKNRQKWGNNPLTRMMADPVTALYRFMGAKRAGHQYDEMLRNLETKRRNQASEAAGDIGSGREFDSINLDAIRDSERSREAGNGGSAPTTTGGQAQAASHSRRGSGESSVESRRRRARTTTAAREATKPYTPLSTDGKKALDLVLMEEGYGSIYDVPEQHRQFFFERASKYMRGMSPDDIRKQRQIEMGLAQQEQAPFVAKDPAMKQMLELREAMRRGGDARTAANAVMQQKIRERMEAAAKAKAAAAPTPPTPRKPSAKFNEYMGLANGNPDLARKLMLQDRVREVEAAKPKPEKVTVPTRKENAVDRILSGEATEEDLKRYRTAGLIPQGVTGKEGGGKWATETAVLQLSRAIVMDDDSDLWDDRDKAIAKGIVRDELKRRAYRIFKGGDPEARGLFEKAFRWLNGR